jgi:prevent-host-death family protein
MSKVLTAEQVEDRLPELIDEVSNRLERIVVTKNGEEKAVLLSKREFESWQETLEVADDEELVTSIKQSLKEAKEGKTIPLEQVIADFSISHKTQKRSIPLN